jgi:hypothetical protein
MRASTDIVDGCRDDAASFQENHHVSIAVTTRQAPVSRLHSDASHRRCRGSVARRFRQGRCRRGDVDPSVHLPCTGRGARRSESADRGDQMALEGTGDRRIARGATRNDASACQSLAEGIRLAQVRSEAEYAASIRDDHRRRGHPLHSCSIRTSGRIADRCHARLARLVHRAIEDHRSVDQSNGVWRRMPSTS